MAACGKHRTDEEVVGSVLLRRDGVIHGVDRCSDQHAWGNLAGILDGHRASPELHAVRIGCQGHIQAVVDDQQRFVWQLCSELPCNLEEPGSRKVLFT